MGRPRQLQKEAPFVYDNTAEAYGHMKGKNHDRTVGVHPEAPRKAQAQIKTALLCETDHNPSAAAKTRRTLCREE